ncbi:hypothetical protein D3C86_1094260 [compost metagenome]
MAAAVTGVAAGRLLHGVHRLRQAGQGVVFGKDRDDRAVAVLEAGQEGRGFVGDARRDVEAGLGQLALEQGGALRLLIAQLRELPDLERGVIQGRLVALDRAGDLGLGLGRQFGGERRNAEAGQGGGERQGAHRDGFHRELQNNRRRIAEGRKAMARLPPERGKSDQKLLRMLAYQ